MAERCGGQEECPELEFQIGATPTKGFLYYLSKDDTWHYSSEHFQRGGGGGGGLFPPPFWCSGQLLRDKKRKRGRNAERDTAIILVSSTTMLGRSFVHSWLQSVATRENERRRHCHTAEEGEKCIFPPFPFRCCFFYIAAARLSFGVPCKNRCCTSRRRSQKTYPFASSLSLPTIATTSETILIATNCFPDISLPPPLLFSPSFFSHWGFRPPRPASACEPGVGGRAVGGPLLPRPS